MKYGTDSIPVPNDDTRKDLTFKAGLLFHFVMQQEKKR